MAEKPGQHVFQSPTGTRDFYPAELNRLRYIHEAWRRTSINHGFDEIDGPTFEHLDLYTAKSGEGIVSELFSFERFGGEKTFALRPEFTPTLARMYAAKAASLPKPTKWFWQQNCFRAERPQRGRLREFSQWNCDIIGDDSAAADAECIACCVGMFESLGLTSKDVRVKISNRRWIDEMFEGFGVPESARPGTMALLDSIHKVDRKTFVEKGRVLGLSGRCMSAMLNLAVEPVALVGEPTKIIVPCNEDPMAETFESGNRMTGLSWEEEPAWMQALKELGLLEWCEVDFSIARGLAYYTGMVFEVHEASGAERAIAGGGRYDKLIEMFGGPPTPAVGFGMGDVVLSLVLQDKGLMPSDDEIAAKLGQRADALVISNGTPEADAQVAPTLAALRRAGLHARRSYKTTKNVGKLIQDAAKIRARFCVILESATQATVKNMDTQGQEACAIGELVAMIGRTGK